MEISKILNELRAERQLIDEVIAGLEQITSRRRKNRATRPDGPAGQKSASPAESIPAAPETREPQSAPIASQAKFPPE